MGARVHTFRTLTLFLWLEHDEFLLGTLTQPTNGTAAFNTFDNARRKMSLGIFNTLAGLSFDKSSSSDSSRRSSSPDVPVVYEQVKRSRITSSPVAFNNNNNIYHNITY